MDSNNNQEKKGKEGLEAKGDLINHLIIKCKGHSKIFILNLGIERSEEAELLVKAVLEGAFYDIYDTTRVSIREFWEPEKNLTDDIISFIGKELGTEAGNFLKIVKEIKNG